MKNILVWGGLVLLAGSLWGQNCPINRLPIPFNDSATYPLEVFDVINNDLARADQGVCAVRLRFLHNAIGDFEVWLRSPAGQEVQLIGPNSTVNYITLATTWNVTFLPCSGTPNPDPPYQSQWNNNINRFAPGNYQGSYFPYLGCLEDFSTGPVNGTWQIKVKTSPTSTAITSRLLAVDIVFCDRRGQRCCFADPGTLPAPLALSTCTADSSLVLPTQVNYVGAPPDSTYGYRYAVARDQVLLRYDSIPDLRDLPPGNYQVCGLSYRRIDFATFPQPDGTLRLDTLRRRLEALDVPYCGELTDSCFQIQIFPRPDTAFIRPTICAGDSLVIGGRTFRQTGRYFVTFNNAVGCDSLLGIDLRVAPIERVTLNPTLCNGDSIQVGNRFYKTSGQYLDTLVSTAGCDSIVTLNLVVRDRIVTSLDTVICAGASLAVGSQSFRAPGDYQVRLTARTGCDSLVLLRLAVDTPLAVISGTVDTLTCLRDTVVLDGRNAQPAGGISFRWEDGTGAPIGDQPTLAVTQPGNYFLQVLTNRGRCANRGSAITVVENRATPVAQILPPDTLNCFNNQVVLNGRGSFFPPNATLTWRTATGRLIGPTTALQARADSAGLYELLIVDPANGCRDSAVVTVVKDVVPPLVEAGTAEPLTCTRTQVLLNGQGSAAGSAFLYDWQGPCVIGNTAALQAQAGCEGLYTLNITNIFNGCRSSDTVRVLTNITRPTADAGSRQLLNCKTTEVTLNGQASSQGPEFRYQWKGPGRTAADTILQVQVQDQGLYTLVVTNTVTSCQDSSTVIVTLDQVPPTANLDPPAELDCRQRTITLGDPGNSVGARFQYAWTSFNGRFSSRTDSLFAVVRSAGLYRLEITDTLNGCTARDSVEVFSNQINPTIRFNAPDDISCGRPSVGISAVVVGANPRLELRWQGPCIVGDSTADLITVDCPGLYRLAATDPVNGCVGSDTVRIRTNAATPSAVVNASTIGLNCVSGIAIIDGSASSGGTLRWEANGQVLSNNPQLTVTAPGIYRLIVEDIGISCRDTAVVTITQNCVPQALVATPDTLNCRNGVVRLDGSASTANLAIRYQWLAADTTCFGGPSDQASITVSCPGIYRLVVTNLALALRDTAVVEVFDRTQLPIAAAGVDATLTCQQAQVELDGRNSSQGSNFRYVWFTDNGDTLSTTLQAQADQAGVYRLQVTNLDNGCLATDEVVVDRDADFPLIRFGTPVIPCGTDTLRFQALVLPSQRTYRYAWRGPAIIGSVDSAWVNLNGPGTYVFTATDLANNCQVTDSIAIATQADCQPCLALEAQPPALSCQVNQVEIVARYCAPCRGCNLQWTTADGRIAGADNTLRLAVTRPGAYVLVVTDSLGVQDTLRVQIAADTFAQQRVAAPFGNLSCRQKNLPLLAANWQDSLFQTNHYALTFLEGTPRLATDTGYLIERPGRYKFSLLDRRTGCALIDSVEVGLDTLAPFAAAGADLMLDCSNPRLTLNGAGSAQGAGIRFQWVADRGGRILAGATSLNPVVDAPGQYTLQVTDARNGCSSRDALLVMASNTLPVFSGLADQVLTCIQTQVLLEPTFAAGLLPRWCTIDAAGDTLACRNQVQLAVTQPGQYLFELRDPSTNCRNRQLVTISAQQEAPVLGLAERDTLDCTAATLDLDALASDGNLQYQWTNRQGLPIVNDTLPVAMVLNGGTYGVEVIDRATGCRSRDSIVVVADNQRPSVDAGLDTAVTCAQPTLRLAGQLPGLNPSTAAINWTAVGGAILNGENTLNPLVGGSGLYVLTAQNPLNGCFGGDVVWVADRSQAPEILIANQDSLLLNCRENTIALRADQSFSPYGNGLRYFWERLTGGEVLGNPTLATVVASGVGVYKVLVTDRITGCRDSAAVQVGGDFLPPFLNLVPPPVLSCTRSNAVLTATVAGSNSPISWQWRGPNGILPDTAATLQVGQPGKYVVTATDRRNGCVATDSALLDQDTIAPQLRLQATGGLSCASGTVEIRPTGLGGRNLSYTWLSPTGGGLVGDPRAPVVRVNAPGWYRLVIQDGINGCTGRDSIRIEGAAGGIDSVRINLEQPGCGARNLGAIRIEAVVGGQGPYAYFLNDAPVLLRGNRLGDLAPGSYNLRLRDQAGCVWTTAVNLDFPPEIGVDLGPDQTIQLGDSLVLRPQLTVDSLQAIRWAGGDGGAPPQGSREWLVAPQRTTTYSVTVDAGRGCVASDVVVIKVIQNAALYIPNAFSPNGDSANDRFQLYADEAVARIKVFQIYDRWGTKVYGVNDFDPRDPNFGWDGTYQGTNLSPGVFGYFVEAVLANGRVVVFKGEVVLVR